MKRGGVGRDENHNRLFRERRGGAPGILGGTEHSAAVEVGGGTEASCSVSGAMVPWVTYDWWLDC